MEERDAEDEEIRRLRSKNEDREGRGGKKSDGYRDEGVLLSSLLFHLARPSPRGFSTHRRRRRRRHRHPFLASAAIRLNRAFASASDHNASRVLEGDGTRTSVRTIRNSGRSGRNLPGTVEGTDRNSEIVKSSRLSNLRISSSVRRIARLPYA